MSESKLQRIGKKFEDELFDIKIEKFKKTKKEPSYPNIMDEIAMHPKFPEIKSDLLDPRRRRIRGALTDIFMWLVVSFVTALTLGLLLYGMGLLTTQMNALEGINANSNLSQISQDTIGEFNNGIQSFRLVGVSIIISMILFIFVSNFFIKAHPAFFIVYVFITVLAIMMSVPLSNAYEGLLNGYAFSVTLGSQTGMTFIMLNLPAMTAVVGIFGAIFLFFGAIRDPGMGGGVI